MQNKETKELIKKNRTTKEITGDKVTKIGNKSTASGSHASIAMDPDTMHENAQTKARGNARTKALATTKGKGKGKDWGGKGLGKDWGGDGFGGAQYRKGQGKGYGKRVHNMELVGIVEATIPVHIARRAKARAERACTRWGKH